MLMAVFFDSPAWLAQLACVLTEFAGSATQQPFDAIAPILMLSAAMPPPPSPPPIASSADCKPAGHDRLWRIVIDAIPDAALALDGAASVVHCNARIPDLFPSARIGVPVAQVTRNPEFLEAIDRAWTAQSAVVVEVLERVPVERRISATISRLSVARAQSNTGDVPALLVTFRDLTAQDRLEQTRSDFVANASHELRTPLALLMGYIETLQGPARNDPAGRERFLAIMLTQATRMARLIDDLLSLSRIELRTHLPPTGVVELNEVAASVAQSLEPLAKHSRTDIAVMRLGRPVRIRADRDEIIQVLQNLIQNAIKYGGDDGSVRIVVREEPQEGRLGPRVAVDVIDQGPGISPEHLPRLTERFYRANVASSREKGGTGLGLAIVKHIVLRHRGDLRIGSVLGKGSTFTVVLDELTPMA